MMMDSLDDEILFAYVLYGNLKPEAAFPPELRRSCPPLALTRLILPTNNHFDQGSQSDASDRVDFV